MIKHSTPILLAGLLPILTAFAEASPATIQLLPLEHRTATEIANSVRPLLADDEAVSAAGNQLLLRVHEQTLEQVKELLRVLDTPRRTLTLRLRVVGSSSTSSSGGIEDLQVNVGGQRASARVLVMGAESNTVSQQSESVVRVMEDSEAWLSFQASSGAGTAPRPRIAVSVSKPGHAGNTGARARVVTGPDYGATHRSATRLRIKPHLRGTQVLADLSVLEADSKRRYVEGSIMSYSGQVELPIDRWVQIATVSHDGSLLVANATYPGGSQGQSGGEIWARFELVP